MCQYLCTYLFFIGHQSHLIQNVLHSVPEKSFKRQKEKTKQKRTYIINDVGQVNNIWLNSNVLYEMNFSLDHSQLLN